MGKWVRRQSYKAVPVAPKGVSFQGSHQAWLPAQLASLLGPPDPSPAAECCPAPGGPRRAQAGRQSSADWLLSGRWTLGLGKCADPPSFSVKAPGQALTAPTLPGPRAQTWRAGGPVTWGNRSWVKGARRICEVFRSLWNLQPRFPSQTRVCTCVCAYGNREPGALPVPHGHPMSSPPAPPLALITVTFPAALTPKEPPRDCFWAPSPGLSLRVMACPGLCRAPSPDLRVSKPREGKVRVLADPALRPNAPDSHFLQLLTPVQAGQPLDLVVRQLPGERGAGR